MYAYGAATDYCIIVPMKLMWGVLGALATSATACRSFVFLSNFRSAAPHPQPAGSGGGSRNGHTSAPPRVTSMSRVAQRV